MNLLLTLRNLKYEARKQLERLLIKLVWHLPRHLVMWCYIRVAANATTGVYSNTVVTELTMMEALERWDKSPDHAD